MASALDREEIRLAQDLERTGISKPASVLAIVMATRGHARPESELVEILRQYPGLESPIDVRRGINELKTKQWLAQTSSYGSTLTHQAPELRELIADTLKNPLLVEKLKIMRANLEPTVRVLGAMKDECVYHTFMDLLRSAEREICLPMLATPPYDETVRILRERAEAGVKVRILLAVPSLVAKWRGEPMRRKAVERIHQWRELFADRESVSIRLCRVAEDMELATCMSMDGVVVRLDIYDPYAQRSLEGVMLEIISPPGLSPNLVRIFQNLFNTAWDRAIQIGRTARLASYLGRSWKVLLALATLGLSFIPVNVPNWPEILIGISCGIGAPIIIEGLPETYKAVQKWRRI